MYSYILKYKDIVIYCNTLVYIHILLYTVDIGHVLRPIHACQISTEMAGRPTALQETTIEALFHKPGIWPIQCGATLSKFHE